MSRGLSKESLAFSLTSFVAHPTSLFGHMFEGLSIWVVASKVHAQVRLTDWLRQIIRPSKIPGLHAHYILGYISDLVQSAILKFGMGLRMSLCQVYLCTFQNSSSSFYLLSPIATGRHAYCLTHVLQRALDSVVNARLG